MSLGIPTITSSNLLWNHFGSPLFLASTPVRGHARVDVLGVGVGGKEGEGDGVMGWAKNVLLDFYMCVMLRCCTFPWTSTHTSYVLLDFYMYAMLRCCTFSWTSPCTSCYAAGWFKKSTSKAATHKDCRQNFPNFWWYLYAAVWRKSVTGKVLNKLGELLHEALRTQKYSFVVVKHYTLQFWGDSSIENRPKICYRKMKMRKLPSFGHFRK